MTYVLNGVVTVADDGCLVLSMLLEDGEVSVMEMDEVSAVRVANCLLVQARPRLLRRLWSAFRAEGVNRR